ncbi:PhoH family protein [Pseudoalteromonas phage J2-1_QLiu-2017]|nr:PhoH family protein [Pseudoalteromonas phage J2-1_QLiu-2017]
MTKAEKRRQRKLRRQERRQAKQNQGEIQVLDDQKAKYEEYKLEWFRPTERQLDIVYGMSSSPCTLVQGGSGCGKSTTAIWQALKMLKAGHYSKIVFIKTPSEDGDDQIGFLTGDSNQKLTVHLDAMRSIFHTFMSQNKLAMEEKRGRIEFTIPNFIAGKTFYNALIIVDEAQKISLSTLKLILERFDDSSNIVLLGDKGQTYSAKKREDGFTRLVRLVTDVDENGRYSVENMIHYVELTSKDNQRGKFSKRIGEIFEELEGQ